MASTSPKYACNDLIRFAHDGDVESLDAAVNSGIDVSYRTNRGTSVLHAAAMSGAKQMILHLLDKHPLCIPNGQKLDKKKKFNALHHWCATNGDTEVFDQLTRAGFDCKETTADRQTSLDLARNTNNDVLVKHIENYLKGPVVDESSPPNSLHQCAIDDDAIACISLITNNNGADVMKLASRNSIRHSFPHIENKLPQFVTPMELALHINNCGVLKILTKFTDDRIVQKCASMTGITEKAKKCIFEGIRLKLCGKYKDGDVVFGTLHDDTKEKVFAVFSTTKTHGTETVIAGYRVLFRNPQICEKDGIDEGRKVLHHCHKHNHLLSDLDKARIDKAIEQECDALWGNHSNIRGITSSPVKCRNGKCLQSACVVIVCLFKSFIPEKESAFPTTITVDGDVVPVDVREGHFWLVGSDNPLATHVPLNMGCNIGADDGTTWHGTLGPFVEIPGGHLGFLACAHVMFSEDECSEKAGGHGQEADVTRHGGTRRVVVETHRRRDNHEFETTERLALQPANGPFVKSSNSDRECGRVWKWDYAIDLPTSIDIAVVKVTKSERIPGAGRFTVYDREQLKQIGYVNEEPTFDTGEKGQPTHVTVEADQATSVFAEGSEAKHDSAEGGEYTPDPRNNIIIFGSTSGPTKGKYGNSSKTQFTTKLCGRTKANERYRGLHYIDNSQCEETHCKLPPLAIDGDSGAGVFQKKGNNSLVCIGVLVAVDNTESALVIPIHPVLEHFDVKLTVFGTPQPH